MIILGNLVTPKWWTDLWLNEGFATYISYLGVEAVEPNFHFLEHFTTPYESSITTIGMQNVLRLDSLGTSHPISITVHNPDEIKEIFDAVSYSKGTIGASQIFHLIKSFTIHIPNYLITTFSYDFIIFLFI